MKISCVILTKNEENSIVDCIESLKFCDEIIFVDDYSEDRTCEIAKKIGEGRVKVFKRKLENNFSQQRNFGLSKTKNQWVLFVDADERIPRALQEEIQDTLSSERTYEFSGFLIRRIDVMWNKRLLYGETGNIKLLRLAQRDKGIWKGIVHEEWSIVGRVGELKSYFLHYPHPTIREFLKEINFYTDLRSQELHAQGEKTNVLLIFLYPLGKFLWNYILKLGFLDGLPGFVFAVMMSAHSFLVRGKLWSLWQRK